MSTASIDIDDNIGDEVDSEPEAEKPTGGLASLLIRGRVERPRRVFMYGQPGVGKSTWATKAPKPVFLQLERGTDDMEGVDRLPMVTSIGQLRQQLGMLLSDPHDFKTVVIDTANALEAVIWKSVAQSANVESIDDIGYGKGFGKATDLTRKVVAKLDELVDKGMNIVVLAHCDTKRVEQPDVPPYDKFVPRMHKDASALWTGWADDVLFACYAIVTIEDKQTKKHRPAGGNRIVRTTEQPFCTAKNRLSLPEILPLEFAAYQKNWSKK